MFINISICIAFASQRRKGAYKVNPLSVGNHPQRRLTSVVWPGKTRWSRSASPNLKFPDASLVYCGEDCKDSLKTIIDQDTLSVVTHATESFPSNHIKLENGVAFLNLVKTRKRGKAMLSRFYLKAEFLDFSTSRSFLPRQINLRGVPSKPRVLRNWFSI